MFYRFDMSALVIRVQAGVACNGGPAIERSVPGTLRPIGGHTGVATPVGVVVLQQSLMYPARGRNELVQRVVFEFGMGRNVETFHHARAYCRSLLGLIYEVDEVAHRVVCITDILVGTWRPTGPSGS